MILKSLEDLEKYRNNMSISKPSVSLSDINEVSEGGGESTNNCNNKLFYWNFKPYYIEELLRAYEKLTLGGVNSGKLHELEMDLRFISQDMMDENTCPIEAILYASKTINNILINNNLLIETIGNVTAEIYSKNKEEYKDTIRFILYEWSWSTQIMILINACGKINDTEFLKIIFDRHTKGDTRLQALKAFMNKNDDICIDYALKLISLTQESDNTEVQMAKYFIHNYTKSFGNKAIKKAEKYLEIPSINKTARKIISRTIPSGAKDESVTLDAMIKKAKNWDLESDFYSSFEEWMNNSNTRKNAFLAIRYSNSSKVEDMVIDILNRYSCNSIEIGTALVTLAQWGSRKGLSPRFSDLINKNKNDITKKVYCSAAMCSLGDEKNAIELIREFLEEDYYESRQVFSIIRDCAYKSNQLLRYAIKTIYDEYLNSDDETKIIKAINGAYELCDKPKFNFKEVALSSIKKSIGLNGSSSIEYSDNIYMALISLIERLLNDKNKDEFIDILFFIIENEKCSSRIKFKAISMLKRLKVDPPK
ncbi:hypothetical protein [Faecalimicrobium sp. JNUCC 81]